MNKVILLVGSKLNGLYVNDMLVVYPSELKNNMANLEYFLQLAEQYKFALEEMEIDFLCKEDDKKTNRLDCLPTELYKFSKEYKGWFIDWSEKYDRKRID